MRIVTWNLNRATWQHRKRFTLADEHRRAAWSTLADLDADLALVQEAPPPPDGLARPPIQTIPAGTDPDDWRSEPGPRRFWCTAIASWGPAILTPGEGLGRRPLDTTHKGAYCVGVVRWRDRPVVIASVYALWDYAGLTEGEKPRYSETSLHRTLSDLTPLIDQHRRNPHPVIVAGDLNASTQFSDPYREAYRLVHARIEALGLINVSRSASDGELLGCPCDTEVVACRHIQTLEGKTPYQNDYIYASADLADAMKLVSLQRTEAMEKVSDHYPLIAEVID